MKSSSIKYSILINFLISIIISMISTLVIIFGLIMIVHIFDSSLYEGFVHLYNTNTLFMLEIIIVIIIIFMIIMFFVFIKIMNVITDYLQEISLSVNKVASGNLNINIPIKADNELGKLAKDINKMASNIRDFTIKEKQWDKHKNNLITNLSHDLRTPLTSVIGFLELIKKKKYKSENELNHYFEISLRKANELKDSVNKLFEFTKISNGDIKLNKSKIYVNELVEQVTMGFIPLFEENNMEYRILPKTPQITTEGDSALLARAFENIISNSIKYGSKGKILDINIGKEEDKVVISFINYGELIEEENLDILFERLHRIEKQCDKKEGTGLGLSIVKAVIKMHSGEILISSDKEKTEFKIIL